MAHMSDGKAGSEMRMPVISLWGPWASWVSLGWKTIETRRHKRFVSLVGRRIGIHITSKWDDTAIEQARPYLTEAQICASQQFLKIGGAIICTALVDRFDVLSDEYSDRALIDCGSVRRYGLFLSQIETIPVIPVAGKQGIWYHDFSVGA